MKIRLLLIVSFLSVLIFAQKTDKDISHSDLQVRYLYRSARDTTDVSNKIEEIMILDFNSVSSLYYSEAFLQRRKSIETQMQIAKNSGGIAEINAGKMAKPKVDYSVYRNKGKTVVTSRLGTDLFSFEGDAPQWEINYREEKSILGYKCKKATAIFNLRKYIAWYTKEIPVSEGPYRFKGLPGLILEVKDENEYDTFSAVAIEKKQTEISKLQKGITVTRGEYLKKREEFKANPFPSRIMDQGRRADLENAIKKFNNSLER